MLAGLLFATHEAEDRAGSLAATLPFGGVTLIEYQARLLIQNDVSQIIVVVGGLPPELVAALARIGRRGVTVDAVRTAGEAKAKLHPLARVIVVADGLVTSDGVIGLLAREGGDTLLVTEAQDAPGAFERLGGHSAWAGLARLDPQRLADVATLPRDYDVQSALVRVAEQAQAHHLLLPIDDLKRGHGIEHRAAALEARSHDVMASVVSSRPAWFDRHVVAPVARIALPHVVRRGLSTAAATAGAGLLAALGLGAMAVEWGGTGILLVLAGTIVAALAATLAWLRDERGAVRGIRIAGAIACALAMLLLGWITDRQAGTDTALVVGVALVLTAGLAERAADEGHRRRWWGTPPAYLALAAPLVIAGWPVAALALAWGYAVATLAAAIEALRGA